MSDHRVIQEWMGRPIETLADLIRPRLRAICVGINPSPVSVEAGHYYQGSLGQRFFGRLRMIGLLPPGDGAWEDDRAFGNGLGFTDIVKRPTASAADVLPGEFAHGRSLLLAKLEQYKPALILFTFKRTAAECVGSFDGCGLLDGRRIAGVPVFVMPGPYAAAALVTGRLEELRRVVLS